MAWTTPVDQTTGTLITATIYNAQIIDNLKYLHGDAGVIGLTNDVSNGPTSPSPGGGGVAGVYLAQAGYLVSVGATVGTTGLALSLTTDSQHRLTSDHNGRFQWGPGGSTAPDSAFGRLTAGVLGDTATNLTTGPTSGSLNGAQTAGVLLNSAGATQAFSSTSTGFILTGAVTTDNGGNYRYSVDASGKQSWAAGGGGATDTTLARGAAGILNVNAKTVEAYATTSGGAGTWTPSLGNGLVQRYNMTATGTLTIASPGTPPANTSGFLVLIIHNASGGTITLSWNAIFNSTPSTPANGAGIVTTWVYNPGTSKWTLVTLGGASTPAE